MANFSVAAVISNHCVLQRNKLISFFGTAENGETITAELSDKNGKSLGKNSAKAIDEKWIVKLPAQTAQNDCTLKITCGAQEKLFTDIAIGEVWLAGGQSNMEFELQNCIEGPAEIANEKNPNVRFYYTNKIAWKDEHFYKAEKNTCWQTWDSEWKKSWSAVGYFYAKKLAADLGVTVGVIGCNWGGTSASAWMNKESLSKDIELKTYLDEQEEATKGKSIEVQCAEYDQYEIDNAEWQKKCDHLYATVPGIDWNEVQRRIGPCLWPGPKSCKSPFRPTGLYECMLQRIIPYTIKGCIWYQGESDDHKPAYYAKLFSTMIDVWRNQWQDSALAFVFVQLPGNRYLQDKDFKHWCLIREAQQKVHDTVKNAFMTCALELGQFNDIHPKAKQVLAERMEQISLYSVYGQGEEAKVYSPMLESTYISGNKITVSFKNAATGFEIHNDDEKMKNYKIAEEIQKATVPEDFTGFEIAGIDGVYHPAKFEFGTEETGLNTIILSSPKVPEPAFARYAWYNYGPITIFGKNGLPVAPFRTSALDNVVATEHAKIQQKMTVAN